MANPLPWSLSLLLAGATACDSEPKPAPPAEAAKATPTAPSKDAKASVDPTKVETEPAPDSRHMDMATKVIAAVASGDYAQLDALQSEQTRQELGDINRRIYDTLRETLGGEGIDLSQAKLLRVESRPGVAFETVDMFIEHEGRVFTTHFNVITLGGKYDFVGMAQWIKWVDEAETE